MSRAREFLLAADTAKSAYDASLKLVESAARAGQWDKVEQFRWKALAHAECFLDNMIASYKETSRAKKG